MISTYGPLIAALIALSGALVTLWATLRRGRQQSFDARRDTYFEAARSAIADILSAAEDFRRDAVVLSVPASFARMGYERATQTADGAEESMRKLRRNLIAARLLIQDSGLQEAIGELNVAFDGVSAVVHESIDSFWERREPGALLSERDQRFDRFDEVTESVQSVAFETLTPSVFRSRQARLALFGCC